MIDLSEITQCAVGASEFGADLQAAAKLALEQGAAVEIPDALIYRRGNQRRYSVPRPSEAGVPKLAASLERTPLNYEHRAITEADPRQGVIGAPLRVVDGADIRGPVTISGTRTLQDMADGLVPRLSVEYSSDRATAHCSLDGASWWDTTASCTHIPGKIYDGALCYVDCDEPHGGGVAITYQPAVIEAGIAARASTDGEPLDLMEPVRARLAARSESMENIEETVEAAKVEAVVEAPVEVAKASAEADSVARLAAAETENAVLRARLEQLEEGQRSIEQRARLSAHREKAYAFGSKGIVGNVKEFMTLRATDPINLATFDDVEALVDAVVGVCTGTQVSTGRLSADVVFNDEPIRTDAQLAARADELAKEQGITFAQARRLALREVK